MGLSSNYSYWEGTCRSVLKDHSKFVNWLGPPWVKNFLMIISFLLSIQFVYVSSTITVPCMTVVSSKKTFKSCNGCQSLSKLEWKKHNILKIDWLTSRQQHVGYFNWLVVDKRQVSSASTILINWLLLHVRTAVLRLL
jgi:hypothetical protein